MSGSGMSEVTAGGRGEPGSGGVSPKPVMAFGRGSPAAPSMMPGGRLSRVILVSAVALVVGAGAAIFFAGRVAGPPAGAPAAVERNTPWLDGKRIRYGETFAAREGLSSVPVRKAVLTPTLQATGVVTWDARRVAAVGARIDGRVRALNFVEGQEVKAGEVLAELESAELGRAQADVFKSRAREQVAKADAVRERTLADAKVAPERDAQFAEATARAATAEREAAERTVEALGGRPEGELGVLRLRAPTAGRVVEVRARRGETVGSKDTLFVVADTERVWVELAVFERDLPAVRLGDEVELRLPADRAHPRSGKVSYVAESIDAERRNAIVRIELDNPERIFKKGLSVLGTIHASGPREERLAVPKAAVTRVDGRPTVFVNVEKNAVEPRSVELGPEDADEVAVLSGLAEGEAVVTGGVLALKSEIFR